MSQQQTKSNVSKLFHESTVQEIALNGLKLELSKMMNVVEKAISRNSTLMQELEPIVTAYEEFFTAEDGPQPTSSTTEPMLPVVQHVREIVAGLPAVKQPIPQSPLPAVMNSLHAMFATTSPLLDIFAPSPWLHDGRGTVTIGSKGFNWNDKVDLNSLSAEEIAVLPSGFYGTGSMPENVLLRMDNCILNWNFKLDPFHAIVFIVGLSDQAPDGSYNWYRASSLSSTFTKQLHEELVATVQKLKRQ